LDAFPASLAFSARADPTTATAMTNGSTADIFFS
jgi:hypothetical protein